MHPSIIPLPLLVILLEPFFKFLGPRPWFFGSFSRIPAFTSCRGGQNRRFGLLKAGADDVLAGGAVSGRPHAASPLAAEDVLQGADADVVAKVELPGDRGRSDVEPVVVVGREVLFAGRFHEGQPLGLLDELAFFQILGEGLAAGPRRDVFDGQLPVASETFELHDGFR